MGGWWGDSWPLGSSRESGSSSSDILLEKCWRSSSSVLPEKCWSSSSSLQSQFSFFQKNEARSGGNPMCFYRDCRSKIDGPAGGQVFPADKLHFFSKKIGARAPPIWGANVAGVAATGCARDWLSRGGSRQWWPGGDGPPAFESGVCVVASVPPPPPSRTPSPFEYISSLTSTWEMFGLFTSLAPQSLRHKWLIRFGACPAFLSQPVG